MHFARHAVAGEVGGGIGGRHPRRIVGDFDDMDATGAAQQRHGQPHRMCGLGRAIPGQHRRTSDGKVLAADRNDQHGCAGVENDITDDRQWLSVGLAPRPWLADDDDIGEATLPDQGFRHAAIETAPVPFDMLAPQPRLDGLAGQLVLIVNGIDDRRDAEHAAVGINDIGFHRRHLDAGDMATSQTREIDGNLQSIVLFGIVMDVQHDGFHASRSPLRQKAARCECPAMAPGGLYGKIRMSAARRGNNRAARPRLHHHGGRQPRSCRGRQGKTGAAARP